MSKRIVNRRYAFTRYLWSYHMGIWEPSQPGQRRQAGEAVIAVVGGKKTPPWGPYWSPRTDKPQAMATPWLLAFAMLPPQSVPRRLAAGLVVEFQTVSF